MRDHEPTSPPNLRGESGAYAAMFIILLAALVASTALVVDMGQNWFSRHDLMATADMAATAGAMGLEPSELGSQREACESAWQYTLVNIPDLPDDIPSPCASFPATGFNCAPAAGAETALDTDVGGLGLYQIAITTPVDDDSPLMQGWLDEQLDGNACFRVGVTIARHNNHLFAGFGGGSTQSTVLGQAVALAGTGLSDDAPVALAVLDPEACLALHVSAGAGNVDIGVKVLAAYSEEEDKDYPGVITIDSDGSDCGSQNSQWVLDPSTNQHGRVIAEGVGGEPGLIFQFALMPGSNIPKAYRTHPSIPPPERFSPQPPLPNDRITRERIDHRYNCKTGYPDYLGIVPIDDCEDADSEPAHIDEFASARALGAGLGGYASYTDYVNDDYPLVSDPCEPNEDIDVDWGDWYIDCPSGTGQNNGLQPDSGVTVTFEGGDLVFQGEIDAGNNGAEVIIGDADGDPTTVFIQRRANNQANHIIVGSQGGISFNNTFVYLERGAVQTGAQASVFWTPPDDEDHRFHFLSLWSEYEGVFNLGGQSGMEVAGTYFAPFADPFRFQGQTVVNQPNNAQFVVRRLVVSGGGYLEVMPNPDDATQFPLPGIRLIR